MSLVLESEFAAAAQMLSARYSPKKVSVANLVGTWHNINRASQNLVKLIIGAASNRIVVDAYGACTPTPCSWGSADGSVYAGAVSGGPAAAFSAQFNSECAKVLVLAHLHGRYLMVETFTQFTDGSGRASYYASDTLAR